MGHQEITRANKLLREFRGCFSCSSVFSPFVIVFYMFQILFSFLKVSNIRNKISELNEKIERRIQTVHRQYLSILTLKTKKELFKAEV